MTTRRVLLALGFAVLCGGSARADSAADAWATAKGAMSSSATVVFGANIAGLKSSALFKQLYPIFQAQAGGKQGIGRLKTVCHIDLASAVKGVVIAVGDDHEGVIYVSTLGVDRSKVNLCMAKLATTLKQPLSIGQPDAQGITEYASDDHKIYLAFFPHGVFAIATDPTNPQLLARWLGGKGLDTASAGGAALAGLNTGATLWGLLIKKEQLDDSTAMSAGFGTATLAAGSFANEVHLVLGSAKQASDLALKLSLALEQAKQGGQLPQQLVGAAKTLQLSAAGNQLVVKATLTQATALAIIGMAKGLSQGVLGP